MDDMRKGICPICDHAEVIEAMPVEFDDGRPINMAVAHRRLPTVFGVGVGPTDKLATLGQFKIYVCRGCGYSQWFADEPMSIPIDEPQFSTRLIKGRPPNSGGPYR